ncbi:hypothetical protein JKP88DRAFT_214344 [Tribonema minus]|uniref:Secreted protein n=1 Tax=Tribonema minus TaxID=303371 RepID=A0A835ZJ54_9STRA|nr:hypothetical protein JKP88DRAFT_214344 [Tribonema minus]
MARFVIGGMLLGACCVQAVPSELKRAMAINYIVCPKEERACKKDPDCAACFKEGDVPPKPADLTTCEQLDAWFNAIDFSKSTVKQCFNVEDPAESPAADLVYCRYDYYAFLAGLKCEAVTEAPTVAPTSAPSVAPSAMPTAAAAQ